MKERPILFKGPMVRRILADAKTQTRRISRLQPEPIQCGTWKGMPIYHDARSRIPSPYGASGDRLWVKETWRTALDLDRIRPSEISSKAIAAGYRKPWAPLKYEADNREVNRDKLRDFGDAWGRTRVSIHMPRWASRITLEVEKVRLQRLQDISEEDAIAEGARRFDDIPDSNPYGQGSRWSMESPTNTDACLGTARFAFANLWIKINGPDSWDLNPWVWSITFRRLEQP